MNVAKTPLGKLRKQTSPISDRRRFQPTTMRRPAFTWGQSVRDHRGPSASKLRPADLSSSMHTTGKNEMFGIQLKHEKSVRGIQQKTHILVRYSEGRNGRSGKAPTKARIS